MKLCTIAPGLLLVGLFTLLQPATSRGQEAIGNATSVKPQAEPIQGCFRVVLPSIPRN
jgi:hypothetical protein